LYEQVLGDSGIHATQYTALQVLKIAPKPTTTEVAELLGIDQTTATRTLALIKKAGLAIDTRGRDRRERRWVLTEEGEAKWRKLKPAWDEAQSAFEERLGRAEAVALKKACFAAATQLAAG
jgi:DNA-binding MarR family transcriptional regulator